MSSILKGLNENYSRDEQDQQNAMDTRRSTDLSRERNAGLNEPDELPTTSVETRNGVYEYNVPAGQEDIAKDLGLQHHRGHWFSRIPIQRANFQFGSPQFHEIPAKGVAEASDDNIWGPQGRFAGDTHIDIGGIKLKPLAVGDIVKYFGEKAKILALAKDQGLARISIESGFGGSVRTVKISDLKQLGQGVAEGDDDFGKPAAMMQPSAATAKTAQNIVQKQANQNVIGMAKIAGAVPAQGVAEGPKEQEYGPEWDEKIKRLGQMAKQGERKTVWDPIKRVYKTVPVQQSAIKEGLDELDENLNKWFKEKWVRFGPDGKIRGDCARGDDSEGKPKCLPQSKAQNLGKKGRASAAARKRREDPNPERSGKAINVNTKKKSNEGVTEGSGGNWYIRVNGKILNDTKFKPVIFSSEDEARSHAMKLADKKRIPLSQMKLTKSWMDAPEQGVAEQELDEACWKGYHKEGNKKLFGKTYPNCVKNTNEEQEQIDEKCWDTHKQVGMKSKGGKQVPNCVPKESIEEQHSASCPHCGGEMVSEELMNEKKDACYYKVKSRYKVWPSAYASGALVKCRKKGADSWGNGGKKNESVEENQLDEKWSNKYKDSINCSDPKGFSQKAHCAGKKKSESAIMKGLVDETLGTPYPGTYEQEMEPFKRKGQQQRVQKIAFEGKK